MLWAKKKRLRQHGERGNRELGRTAGLLATEAKWRDPCQLRDSHILLTSHWYFLLFLKPKALMETLWEEKKIIHIFRWIIKFAEASHQCSLMRSFLVNAVTLQVLISTNYCWESVQAPRRTSTRPNKPSSASAR